MAAMQVTEWAGWGLANAEFLYYSQQIVAKAATFDTEKIPVSAAVSELRTLNTTLVDFINEASKSDRTATIAALDAKRDGLFHALYAAVEYLANVGATTGVCGNAVHLQTVLGAYKGIAKHALAKETLEIEGLQFDLEKKDSVTALKETGLYKIAGELFETNASFKAAYSGRADERGEKKSSKDGESTASLRKQAAALIVKIIRIVNSLNNIDENEATIAAAKALDSVVTEYKLILSTAHGKKKGSDPSPDPSPAPDPEGETDPEASKTAS